MQMDSRFFDDLARVASGALGAFGGVREQMEAQLRAPLERMLQRLDVVSREDFEAVQIIASRAREEQEKLAERVAMLERAVADLTGRQSADDADPLALQGSPEPQPSRRGRSRARRPSTKALPPDQE
jgi:BMFP domain-containing protein YqiC